MNQKTLTNFFLLFLFLAVLAEPLSIYAGALVNINTADKATLMTLNGLGGTGVKAQAVIDYRTANGPFAKIEDIMNVSGIGTATFNGIKDSITVGDTGATQTTTTNTSTQTTSTQTSSQNQVAGAGPPAITALIVTDSRVTAGGGSYFSATAYGAEDVPLPNARFIWNFGDGTTGEGARIFHTFAYPGRYAVSVTAAYNYSTGSDRITIEAASAAVSLEVPGDGSLTIFNKSSKEINIGLWSLVDGGKSYLIPEGTMILTGEGVRFAAAITGLSGSPSAVLLYPNGMPAAAAVVSADSPMRGERVGVATKAISAQKHAGEVLGATTSILAAVSGKVPSSLWISLGALSVLLVGSAGAVHYVGLSTKRSETGGSANEFDIE